LDKDEDKMMLETDIDNPDITSIGISIDGCSKATQNKKTENIHKHIANIRKYINKF
jgi:phosphopantetheine adenylyltransferase